MKSLSLAILISLSLIQPIHEPVEIKYKQACNNVKCEIVLQSEKYGVDTQTALRIAQCESQYGLYTHNSQSTAKGIYQFIDKTWENYCTGDVLNPKDNIQCFMELYEQHPTWWECS